MICESVFFAATVKQLCEIELGLVSQCCLSDHIRNGKRDYIANLLLKINAKARTPPSILSISINPEL